MYYGPERIDVFNKEDYYSLIKRNIINYDLVFRGKILCQIDSVKKVVGSLGISGSPIYDLGELSEVTRDFWISHGVEVCPLKNLQFLEKIGNNGTFRYSSIESLGALRYVGGNLSLRDTSLVDLGELRFVGGNLLLPNRFKYSQDLKNIEVIGEVKFWKESKISKLQFQVKKEIHIGLKLSVPTWNQKYVYSNTSKNELDPEQLTFYVLFKSYFLKSIQVDLNGYNNYAFLLFFEFVSEYKVNKDIDILEGRISLLSSFYPDLTYYVCDYLISEYEQKGMYELSWRYLKYKGYTLKDLWEYYQKLNNLKIDSDFLLENTGASYLTEFGQKNIDKIISFIGNSIECYEEEHQCKFLELFFSKGHYYRIINSEYSPDYYKKFFLNQRDYERYLDYDIKSQDVFNKRDIPYVVENALYNQFRLILRIAENKYRESVGIPKIGEGWVSETELFYLLLDTYSNLLVQQHGRPIWLGRQHLDIYFPSLNIGVEYQGIQHFSAVEYFGGEVSLKKNIERDQRKRELCKKHGCILIYVEDGYNLTTIINEIDNAISLRFTSEI